MLSLDQTLSYIYVSPVFLDAIVDTYQARYSNYAENNRKNLPFFVKINKSKICERENT